MLDELNMISEEEARKITANFFLSTDPPVLKVFPAKNKNKLVILRVIAGQFEKGRIYGEKEINEILLPIYNDFATIRRYLVDCGFLKRTADCREYWIDDDRK